jgi:hypothetical protein
LVSQLAFPIQFHLIVLIKFKFKLVIAIKESQQKSRPEGQARKVQQKEGISKAGPKPRPQAQIQKGPQETQQK